MAETVQLLARGPGWSQVLVRQQSDGQLLLLVGLEIHAAPPEAVAGAVAEGWEIEDRSMTWQELADIIRHEGRLRQWALSARLIDTIRDEYPDATQAAIMVRRGDGSVSNMFVGDIDWADAVEMLRRGPDLADHIEQQPDGS